jgi:hypothetical protein
MRKMRGREQDSGKREWVRDRALLEERDNVGNNIDRYRKHVV